MACLGNGLHLSCTWEVNLSLAPPADPGTHTNTHTNDLNSSPAPLNAPLTQVRGRSDRQREETHIHTSTAPIKTQSHDLVPLFATLYVQLCCSLRSPSPAFLPAALTWYILMFPSFSVSTSLFSSRLVYLIPSTVSQSKLVFPLQYLMSFLMWSAGNRFRVVTLSSTSAAQLWPAVFVFLMNSINSGTQSAESCMHHHVYGTYARTYTKHFLTCN